MPLNETDLRFKMLANMPVYLEEAGEIFLPTLREIAEMGLSRYTQQLSFLLLDRNSFPHFFDERVTNFDLFYANCFHNESFREVSYRALRLFFHVNAEMVEEGGRIFFRFEHGGVLDHDNFPTLQYMLTLANYLKNSTEPEYNPVNSKAQEMVSLILKNRKKQPRPKEKMDLSSIVSGLAWKPNGIRLPELFELNIYQVYTGFFITNNIDHYHHTLAGIYAGTLDGKNIKMSDLHWANKI